MKPRPIIAIDPGKTGAIAYWQALRKGPYIDIVNMPDTLGGIHDYFQNFAMGFAPVEKYRVVMEKNNGYVPGNSGASAAKFSRHIGELHGVLYTLGYSVEQVAPSVWMKWLLGTVPKEKAARKTAIHDKVQRLYPQVKITKRNADAMGILAWGLGVR